MASSTQGIRNHFETSTDKQLLSSQTALKYSYIYACFVYMQAFNSKLYNS